jgi:hypothetical protein
MAVSALITADLPINDQRQRDRFEDDLEPIVLRRGQASPSAFRFQQNAPKFDVNRRL